VLRAAFVDRDGTINVRPPPHTYLQSAEPFRWLPGAVEGLVCLAEQGYSLIVVSNQRGIARGLVSRAALHEIEQRIQLGLAPHGQRIEAFNYCPHEIADACMCRKPAPGLLLDAAHDHDIDLSRSWMIGDAESDVLAGLAAGTATARVASETVPSAASIVAPSLLAVSRAIAGIGAHIEGS
jgi:D-glycero-D-manno-heptose 1,7-bisphosphate phosphatase